MPTALRFAAAALVAAVLSACQTAGLAPPLPGVAIVEREGFVAQDAAVMNQNLAPDDIRTTALYLCTEPRCGGFGIVAFGVEPPGLNSADEIKALGGMSRAQAVRTAGRILRSAGLKELNVVDVRTAVAADRSQIVTMDLRGRIAGDAVHLRLTAAYREGPGRMVAAVSARREMVVRFGGREMLGL